MLGLAKTTEFNKRIPKQKFYENLAISPALKKVFVNQVKTIYWRNKIATTTLNLASGTSVTEIEVFEIKLSEQTLDEGILRQMDKEIPYHILFLLEYQGKYQAWIGYKEVSTLGTVLFKVNKYYHTEWLEEDDLPVKLEGLDMDSVYENFVRQIAGVNIKCKRGQTLEESVTNTEMINRIKMKIKQMTILLRKEKQFSKQILINKEIKELKKQLGNLYEKGV